MKKETKQIKILYKAALIMLVGLMIFKWYPMSVWGKEILFDASLHITTAFFVLYVIWFFIDQNKKWRIPFFIFAALVLAIVSIQRIEVSAHNDVGLLVGLIISVVAIFYSQFDRFKKKIDF